jgi:hypothetical protein
MADCGAKHSCSTSNNRQVIHDLPWPVRRSFKALRLDDVQRELHLPNDTALLETVKRRYIGKWIVLKGSDVLLVSDNHDEVMRELRHRNIDGAYVFYSPTETEKQYSFLFLEREWKFSNENSSVK